jgi:hypothetical protein
MIYVALQVYITVLVYLGDMLLTLTFNINLKLI